MSNYLDSSFFDKLFALFMNLRAEILPWVISIIMIRVLINLVMFKSVSDMGVIVKDVFFGMILLCFFVEIIKFSQMIPNMLHARLSSPEQVEVSFADGRVIGWTIASYVTVGAYWIAKLIYMVFIGILIGTGAFVIIAGTMLAQRYLLNLFFIGLFGASLMPLLWFSINEGMKAFAKSDGRSFSNFFILVAGELLKLGIPIGGAAAVLKTPFVTAAKNTASIPIVGANKLYLAASSQLRPESKMSQFMKVARGGTKDAGLNNTARVSNKGRNHPDGLGKFKSSNSPYQYKRNKAQFNDWLHDKTPPVDQAKGGNNLNFDKVQEQKVVKRENSFKPAGLSKLSKGTSQSRLTESTNSNSNLRSNLNTNLTPNRIQNKSQAESKQRGLVNSPEVIKQRTVALNGDRSKPTQSKNSNQEQPKASVIKTESNSELFKSNQAKLRGKSPSLTDNLNHRKQINLGISSKQNIDFKRPIQANTPINLTRESSLDVNKDFKEVLQ